MIHLNQSEEQKERASKALKKTWKEYPDFNELSHQWQKDDPERLKKVTKKALELAREKPRYVSKCEKQIKEWLHELGFKTKTNRFIIEGKNRFYDVRIDKLLIEIDGPWHFKHFYKRFNESNFDETVDKLKNQHAINNGYTLIRISNWGDKLEDQKVAIMAYINSYLLGTLDQTKIHYWGKAYEN